MTTTLQLTATDGFSLPAYVARPTGQPKGAIVVLQEIFGVNSHIRSIADGYAAQGYVAIAPATFHRIQADVNLGYTQDDITAGVALKAAAEALPAPGVLQDIAAAVAYGAQFGKVGVVGYCWGGLLTWRAACTLRDC
jgi:carboxymethylenebutenolidase